MTIDIYTHIFPGDFYRHMSRAAPRLENIGKRMQQVKMIHDLDIRFPADGRVRRLRAGNLAPQPAAGGHHRPGHRHRACADRQRRDGRSGRRHPDRFVAFIAALAMHDMDSAMDELHRAVRDLGARGIQIFTNVGGRALDDPGFHPCSRRWRSTTCRSGCTRRAARTCRITRPKNARASRCGGVRLALRDLGGDGAAGVLRPVRPPSGYQDHHPPHGRHDPVLRWPRRAGHGGGSASAPPTRTTPRCCPPWRSRISTISGCSTATPRCSAPISGSSCGLEFFGIDHAVFSTDCPFAPVRETFRSVEDLGLSDEDRDKLYGGNARRLMRLDDD